MSEIQAQKKALRGQLIESRRTLSVAEIQFKSRLIASQLLSLEEIQAASVIHVFWPIEKNREVDIRSLIRSLVRQGKQCVLPRVISFTDTRQNKPRMEHRLFLGETNLKANRWDVYEPVDPITVPVDRLNAIVVPALAVDTRGIRLGYGKGYYDEFLREIRCPTICPIFNPFLLEQLPREAHDIPVDIVVTESTVIRTEDNAT